MTSATGGTGTAYPPGAPEFTSELFYRVRVAQPLVFFFFYCTLSFVLFCLFDLFVFYLFVGVCFCLLIAVLSVILFTASDYA